MARIRIRKIPLSIPLIASALVLVAAACGSSGSDDVASLVSNDVATLSGAADAATIPDEDEPETSPEAAALAFSQCMRDEGIDFPDLAIDAEGNIQLREGFTAVDRSDESVREALQTCQPELAAGGFGGGRRAALQSPEVQDGLVAFSDCIRDEGFDVGDLTLGQGPGAPGGQQPGQGGDGDGPAAGQRQGGFGNPSNRIAQQLGLDLDDPVVEAALDTCSPILEDVFAGLGGGGPNR